MNTYVNRKKVVAAAVFITVISASVVLIGTGYFDSVPDTGELSFDSPPTEEWNRTYGEESGEERAFLVYSLTQVEDRYVLIGDTHIPSKLESKSWFGVANESGELVVKEVVGDGSINTVVPAEDEGAVVAIDGVDRISELVKFSLEGDKIWKKEFPHIGPSSSIDSVSRARDGFVVAGATHELGADSGFDMWVARVGSDGEEIWENWFDNNGSIDKSSSVVATEDGGFVVAGNTWKYSDGERVRSTDRFLVKVNSEGEKLWKTIVGGQGSNSVGTIVEASNGGIVLTGGAPSGESNDVSDIWVAKLTASGELAWNSTYDFGSLDTAKDAIATQDGGILIAGSSIRRTGIRSASRDMWLTKVNSDGEIVWKENYDLNTSNIANIENQETPTSVYLSDGGELLMTGYVSTPPGSEGFLTKLIPDEKSTVSSTTSE
jgi:hypothetical protein